MYEKVTDPRQKTAFNIPTKLHTFMRTHERFNTIYIHAVSALFLIYSYICSFLYVSLWRLKNINNNKDAVKKSRIKRY